MYMMTSMSFIYTTEKKFLKDEIEEIKLGILLLSVQ